MMTSPISTADIDAAIREMIRQDESIITEMHDMPSKRDKAAAQAAIESRLSLAVGGWCWHHRPAGSAMHRRSAAMPYAQARRELTAWRKARVLELLTEGGAP